MAIDNKKVIEFEEQYKEALFSRMEKMYTSRSKLISNVHELEEYFDIETQIPNIGITANNKLIEMQNEFKKAGISMYASKLEEYGPLKLNYIGTSFIGNAVINDLIGQTNDGSEALINYRNGLMKIIKKLTEEVKAIQKMSPVKKLFAHIRSLFNPIEQEVIMQAQEELDLTDKQLLKYKEINEKIWKYNLRENIVQSIVKKFREEMIAARHVPEILEETIKPDLQKLEIENLIPELKTMLIEEYKKDLKGFEENEIEDEIMYLFVPDFEREKEEIEEIDYDEIKMKIDEVLGCNRQDQETTIKEEPLKLEELIAIEKELREIEKRNAEKESSDDPWER